MDFNRKRIFESVTAFQGATPGRTDWISTGFFGSKHSTTVWETGKGSSRATASIERIAHDIKIDTSRKRLIDTAATNFRKSQGLDKQTALKKAREWYRNESGLMEGPQRFSISGVYEDLDTGRQFAYVSTTTGNTVIDNAGRGADAQRLFMTELYPDQSGADALKYLEDSLERSAGTINPIFDKTLNTIDFDKDATTTVNDLVHKVNNKSWDATSSMVGAPSPLMPSINDLPTTQPPPKIPTPPPKPSPTTTMPSPSSNNAWEISRSDRPELGTKSVEVPSALKGEVHFMGGGQYKHGVGFTGNVDIDTSKALGEVQVGKHKLTVGERLNSIIKKIDDFEVDDYKAAVRDQVKVEMGLSADKDLRDVSESVRQKVHKKTHSKLLENWHTKTGIVQTEAGAYFVVRDTAFLEGDFGRLGKTSNITFSAVDDSQIDDLIQQGYDFYDPLNLRPTTSTIPTPQPPTNPTITDPIDPLDPTTKPKPPTTTPDPKVPEPPKKVPTPKKPTPVPTPNPTPRPPKTPKVPDAPVDRMKAGKGANATLFIGIGLAVGAGLMSVLGNVLGSNNSGGGSGYKGGRGRQGGPGGPDPIVAYLDEDERERTYIDTSIVRHTRPLKPVSNGSVRGASTLTAKQAAAKYKVRGRFIGADDYGKDLRNFIEAEGTITYGTFYSPPATGVQRTIRKQLTKDSRIIVQKPYSTYDLNEYKVMARSFHHMLDKVGVKKTIPVIQQHSKTLVKAADGEEKLFLGTGNFTAGALKDDPLIDRSGKPTHMLHRAMKALPYLGNIPETDTMSQVNFGVVIENQVLIDEYKDLIEKAGSGLYSESTENFIVGGPTGRSAEAILGHLDKAEEMVQIVSPYMDSSLLMGKIEELEARGVNVDLMTTPLHSDYQKGTGGNIGARARFLARAIRAGANVYMTPPDSSILMHAKAISVDGALGIVGSHNFTNKAEDGSIELSAVGAYGEQISAEFEELIATGIVVPYESIDDSLSLAEKMADKDSTFKLIQKELNMLEYMDRGIGNEQYAYLLADDDHYFTLPASMGASAHHGADLEYNLMVQNSYYNLADRNQHRGMAQSIMEYNHFMLHGEELSQFETFLARSYDSGLQTGGAGNWLNRNIFIPMGWGRVYKDEKGAISSVAGLAGKILDEGYMYYSNISPDWISLGHDYQEGVGMGAMEGTNRNEGMFESMFSNTASFVEAMAQSLGMYVAITAPMEMIKAQYYASTIEGAILGTLQENTPFNTLDNMKNFKGAQLMSQRGWRQKLAAEFFFGDMGASASVHPGGLTAIVLEERFRLDDLNHKYGTNQVFFDHEQGTKSGMHTLMMIQRGRAKMVLEGTFKPFMMEVVNPFNISAIQDKEIPIKGMSGPGFKANAHDQFIRSVQNLIDVIAAPVDLEVDITKGLSAEWTDLVVQELKGDTAAEQITAAKAKGGFVTFGPNTTSVRSYGDLKDKYDKAAKVIDANLKKNNQAYLDALMDLNISEADALDYMFNGKRAAKAAAIEAKIQGNPTKSKLIAEYQKIKAEYVKGKNALRAQLGNASDKLTIRTTNTGVSHKTQIAAALQDVLDMTPLNPLKWGLFSQSAESADDFLAIGQLFSFKAASEFTQRILTGDTSASRVLKEMEAVAPDASVSPPTTTVKAITRNTLSSMEQMSNVVKSKADSADRIMETTWDNIRKFFKTDPDDNFNIDNLTRKFRQAERAVTRAADEANRVARETARKAGESVPDAIKAFDLAVKDLVVADIGKETEGLLSAVIDYTHQARGQYGKKAEAMAETLNRSGLTDVTEQIVKGTGRFSAKVGAEKFIMSSTGWLAAVVFTGMALNQIAQGTGGVSLVTQLSMALYGEDEDIAVKFEGNRFLPTEMLAVHMGWNQTAVNFVADTIGVASVTFGAYKIASMMKEEGLMAYTFDEESIYKLFQNEKFKISQGGKVFDSVDALKKAVKEGGDKGIITVAEEVQESGKTIIKNTVLKYVGKGFRTEDILQSFAKNVPAKTFVFGALGLLAFEGLRKSAGHLLSVMGEAPEDKSILGITAGAAVGLGIMGAMYDNFYKATADAGTEVMQASGKVLAKSTTKAFFKTGMTRWAVGGALAVGAAALVGKLVFNDKIEQRGSLDPILAGAGVAGALLMFKGSIALAAAGGLAAMAAMSALNWAGISFAKTGIGRIGKEVDPHTAKLVTQLSQFSSASLDLEKGRTLFHLAVGAYASQLAANQNILAKDHKSIAGDTQVIAKQAPLPFLQFFVAERIEGKRGQTRYYNGPDNERTIRTYTLGIQTGALFGTSLSVELPVSYTPGEGFYGFTYNAQGNLMSVPKLAARVGVWGAAFTGMMGIGFRFGEAINVGLYNRTGKTLFRTGAENFAQHADDMFAAGRFLFSAAEKITSMFMRQTIGIFTTLQGANARMMYGLYKDNPEQLTQVAQALKNKDLKRLSMLDTGLDTIDEVAEGFVATKKGWANITQSTVMKWGMRGRHAFFGAILGMAVGGLVATAMKDREIRAHHEAGATQEKLIEVEDAIQRRRMWYVIIGGASAGIANDLRNSAPLLGNISDSVGEALNRNTKSIRRGMLDNSWSRAISGIAEKPPVRNMRAAILKSQRSLMRIGAVKKGGVFAAVFALSTAFAYIQTHSEFGIAKFMDRHISYDNKGNAYDDYELQTEFNPTHQALVAAGMGTLYTAGIYLAAAPQRSQQRVLLNAVKRRSEALKSSADEGFFTTLRKGIGHVVFGLNRFSEDREAMRLLRTLASLEEEAAAIKAWEFKRANGDLSELPPQLRRLAGNKGVMALRNNLDKDQIREFLDLEKRRKAGITLVDDEMVKYQGFLSKVEDVLDTTKGGKNFKHLSRGFRQSARFKSFATRAAVVYIGFQVAKWAINTVGNQGGEQGVDTYLDRIYNQANEIGRIGQKGPDGEIVGLEGLASVGADILRLITGRDIVNMTVAVDTLNGKFVKSTGQRLISNNKGMADAQRTIKDLSEMLILDNPNSYIATLNFGGRTFRQGDKGSTTSSYFQLQGPGQDISTATYSMAAKFAFDKFTAGKGRLSHIVSAALRDFNADDVASFDKAAVGIRNATAMNHALKTSRKYSRATHETAAAFMGDSLAAAIQAKREHALAHAAWQSSDSLFTNMFFETMDKARNRNQDNAFAKFLMGITSNQSEVLNMFAKLMEGGMFEGFFRESALRNVKFFSGTFGKPPKQSGPQHMIADISALWHQSHSISVQAEMFKQSRVELVDNFVDKVVMPMATHDIMVLLPKELQILGSLTVGASLSAVMIMSVVQLSNVKQFREQTAELLDVFGKKEATKFKKLDIVPTDLEHHAIEIKKKLEEIQSKKWRAKDAVDDLKFYAKIGRESNEAALMGVMDVAQGGTRSLVRFRLSHYLDETNVEDFYHTLQKKGDDIRKLFMVADTDKNMLTVLTETVEVTDWIKAQGINAENVYDVFLGTGKVTLQKKAFIQAAQDQFTKQFSYGVDNMFDLVDGAAKTGTGETLFDLVEVNVEGKTVQMYKGELFDPNFTLEKWAQDTSGPTMQGQTQSDLNLESRKDALVQRYKAQRAAFLEEIRGIVADEMEAIQFKSRNARPSAQEQIELVQEAKRRALHRIKTAMEDPNTAIGQTSRGAGLITPETVVDEQGVIQQVNQRVKIKNTKNAAGKTEVDEFLDDVLHYTTPKGKAVTYWDTLGMTGKGIMTGAFVAFDVLTGMDILGSYMRYGRTLTDPMSSSLDIEMQRKELGRAIMTSLVGLAQMGIVHGLGKLTQIKGVEKVLKNPNTYKKGAGLLVGAAALMGMGWKSIIQPGMEKLNKFRKESTTLRALGKAWDNAWFATSDVVGHLASAPIHWGHYLGGEAGAWFTTGLLGGTIAVGIAGIGMGVLGIPLAFTALGAGLVLGVAAVFKGKEISQGLDYTTREIMKLPVIGQFTGMTDPYRQIRNQSRFRHHFVNSPFLLGYVGDIINNSWMQYLGASEDPTGRDMVSFMYGEVMSEGEGYGVAHSAWRAASADGMIGRPQPIFDEVISNELKIRGEYLSDNHAGRYSWDQMVQYSDMSNATRAREAQTRAERIRIQALARERILKAAQDGGGPTESMKTGSTRKAALIGLAAKRVELASTNLDTDNAAIQVTGATVAIHKQHVKNRDQEDADNVKGSVLEGNAPPNTIDFDYKVSVNIFPADGAFVGFDKDTAVDDTLSKASEVYKAKATEDVIASAAYNSHREEA